MDNTNTNVIERLNILIKLSAANIIQGKSFAEQVDLLSMVGLQPKEIGELLNKSANHVSVTLNALKKKKK